MVVRVSNIGLQKDSIVFTAVIGNLKGYSCSINRYTMRSKIRGVENKPLSKLTPNERNLRYHLLKAGQSLATTLKNTSKLPKQKSFSFADIK